MNNELKELIRKIKERIKEKDKIREEYSINLSKLINNDSKLEYSIKAYQEEILILNAKIGELRQVLLMIKTLKGGIKE